jgi:hypothetical protein
VKDWRSSRFPVTVRQLPLIRCQLCGRTMAHRPGTASDVLTEHYHRKHADILPGAERH